MTQITNETISVDPEGLPNFPRTFIFLVLSFPLYTQRHINIWVDVFLRGETTVLQI